MSKIHEPTSTPYERGRESTMLLLGAAVMKKLNFDDDLITEESVHMTIEKFPWIIEHAGRKDVMGGAFKTFVVKDSGTSYLMTENMRGPGGHVSTLASAFLNIVDVDVTTKRTIIREHVPNVEYLKNFKVETMTYRVARVISQTLWNIFLSRMSLHYAYVSAIREGQKTVLDRCTPYVEGTFHDVTIIHRDWDMMGRAKILLENMVMLTVDEQDLHVGDVLNVKTSDGRNVIEKIGATTMLRPEVALYHREVGL